MLIPLKIRMWLRYNCRLWKIEEKYDKKKARILYRLRRVQCALSDHMWVAEKPPKYATREWREMAPMALLRMSCVRCGERKFDNNRRVENQIGEPIAKRTGT